MEGEVKCKDYGQNSFGGTEVRLSRPFLPSELVVHTAVIVLKSLEILPLYDPSVMKLGAPVGSDSQISILEVGESINALSVAPLS